MADKDLASTLQAAREKARVGVSKELTIPNGGTKETRQIWRV